MNILENSQMNLIQPRQTKLESQKKFHHTIKDKNNIDLTEGDKILFFPHYSGYDNVPGKISEISILKKETKPAEYNLIIESDKPLCGFRKKHTPLRITNEQTKTFLLGLENFSYNRFWKNSLSLSTKSMIFGHLELLL